MSIILIVEVGDNEHTWVNIINNSNAEEVLLYTLSAGGVAI